MGKKILPVRVQEGYKPIKWLNFIFGNNLWLNFFNESDNNNNNKTFTRMIEFINDNTKKIHSTSEEHIIVENSSEIENWTKEDVQNFLIKECELNDYASR